jgi:hypothetical protein
MKGRLKDLYGQANIYKGRILDVWKKICLLWEMTAQLQYLIIRVLMLELLYHATNLSSLKRLMNNISFS